MILPSLPNARFWVRPYEFEGDGSNGEAQAMETLQVGGRERTFWLKELEGRLFFREVGRGEEWNFGSLEAAELRDFERILEEERFGRVILPFGASRPCLLLVAANRRIVCLVLHSDIVVSDGWKKGDLPRNLAFLDWGIGHFEELLLSGVANIGSFGPPINHLHRKMDRMPVVTHPEAWLRGSLDELENLFNALFFNCWEDLAYQECDEMKFSWELKSAWAMRPMEIYGSDLLSEVCNCESRIPPYLKPKVRFLLSHFLWVGQVESRYGRCEPRRILRTLQAPTFHERIEAHRILKEWVSQKMAPEEARDWLNFP